MSRAESMGGSPSMDELQRSYDEIPYPDRPKPYTHITGMAAIACFHNLSPPPPDNCSVLELGCADGGNLLPMAWGFPQSRFTGIDFSSVQVEIGRQGIRELSLTNVELRRANILDLCSNDLGRYDYIIVHGVYSWVPAEVQDKILGICRDHLSDTGLAYISYNTYPGWRGKQALREILRYHTRHIEDTRQKVEAALALVARLPDSKVLPGDPGALQVQHLQNDLKEMEDPRAYLVHEYLIDGNEPLYFNEFLRRVEGVQLRYIDDAFPGSTALERLPSEARTWVESAFPDYLEQQQYIDYFCNVSFRRSLLCRGIIQPRRRVRFNPMKHLYATATCRRAESEKGQPYYVTRGGRRISTEHGTLRMILDLLLEARPGSLSVNQLRVQLGDQVTDREAGEMLAALFRNAVLEITSHPRDCIGEIKKRPYASGLVRFQSLDGVVTNAAHRPVRLENIFERYLLKLLNGTRTVAELIIIMQKRLRPDPPMDDKQWETEVRDHLVRFVKLGLIKDPKKK